MRGPPIRRAAFRPARAVGLPVVLHGAATAEGPVSHFLGGLAAVLGRYDEADAYFSQAAAFNERMGAKFFAARTDLSWARLLAERNTPADIDKARALSPTHRQPPQPTGTPTSNDAPPKHYKPSTEQPVSGPPAKSKHRVRPDPPIAIAA